MGEFRIYGTLKGHEITELREMIPDMDIKVEHDPGQTIETYVMSRMYNDKTIEHAVNHVMGRLEKPAPRRGVDLGKINLKKFIDENSGRNYVEKFSQFESIKEFVINEKKKIDQDGDGDTDFVDAKVAQYTKGGIPKDKAIAKAKMFAKKNSIPDNGIKKTTKKVSKTSVKGQVKNSVLENFLFESDWYQINKPGWHLGDGKGQETNYTMTTRSWIEHKYPDVDVPFDDKDMVMIKDTPDWRGWSGKPAQVINMWFNKDTHELIYGIRIFSDPGRDGAQGSTTLIKVEPTDLEPLRDVPNYVTINHKYEKPHKSY
jgi:hypothetical protein